MWQVMAYQVRMDANETFALDAYDGKPLRCQKALGLIVGHEQVARDLQQVVLAEWSLKIFDLAF